MEPIVFIDSLDNISIVNLNVPALSSCDGDTDSAHDLDSGLRLDSCYDVMLSDHLDRLTGDDVITDSFAFSISGRESDQEEDEEASEHVVGEHVVGGGGCRGRRTTSSLDKVRTWKKYKNKKHLSQLELDRKRDLANKQERRRMHRLNDALNRLRQVIPIELQANPPRRLSKIKTLQSAIKYIRRLEELLQ